MMFSVLNRYLIKRVIFGVSIAFLIVTSIIMLVDFVEGSRNIGPDDNISAGLLLLLTLLKAPTLIEQTICLLYTSPSPRDQRGSRMPSSA